jgi:hypothetical protein
MKWFLLNHGVLIVPETFAVKDAALGIRLKDGKIFYHKDYGLDFEEYD